MGRHGCHEMSGRDGMVRYGMEWYGMVWYGMAWYDYSNAMCSNAFAILCPTFISYWFNRKKNIIRQKKIMKKTILWSNYNYDQYLRWTVLIYIQHWDGEKGISSYHHITYHNRHDMTWHDMTRHDWHDTIWQDTTWQQTWDTMNMAVYGIQCTWHVMTLSIHNMTCYDDWCYR